MNIKGVITGDIVSSSTIKAEWRDTLLRVLQEIVDELKTVSDLKIEFFRGDSFQILVDNPEKVLDIAILFRAALMSRTPTGSKQLWDARMAIGVGAVAFLSESIIVSDGEAFRLSGRSMDLIKKRKLTIHTRWTNMNEELKVSTAFADDIVSHWTQAQAEVIFMSLLHDMPQKKIALKIGKTPQTISKLLGLAKEYLIKLYLERYHSLISKEIAP
ncbi:MAG: SatD family protein [Bacteroidales bacterium]|jgi:hypothetical protein|nr:SatD family protein [Bacteroidales bacterium]MDD2264888.1 hypothetical protein [Bacteroidales bacterium]MDD2831964.1 hypothetical protein [Bacteroidales bacterium]MDD4473575.1 hypothetical protein [Bacteroidales bacterium]MDD5047110.1 hypothetical protein [Bacteroidales bacterium]